MNKLYIFGCVNIQQLLFSLVAILTVSSVAANPIINPIADQQIVHQQERQKALEMQLQPKTEDVRFDLVVSAAGNLTFPVESPCFSMTHVTLSGVETLPRWLNLATIADQAKGFCLGGAGINLLMGSLQDQLIKYGYVTSRILAPEQDLNSGNLVLLVLPGKVNQIKLTPESSRYIRLFNTLPASQNALLDLRDIEQGLENLQRIPYAQADINIVPSDKPGESDLLVSWQQTRFWRLAGSFDDSGTVSTGRYQGGLTFQLDNPLSMGDMFYISAGHDVQGRTARGSRNYSANYSIPLGYWSISSSVSGNSYQQNVAGLNENYEYSGRSKNASVRLSHLLHRNASQKTTVYYDVNFRESRNYVNDTEVEIQRRRTASWKAGISHRHYINRAVLDADLSYQRGTRWFAAIAAPEEEFNEATALSKITRLSLSLNQPFTLLGQNFRYSPSYQQQWAHVSLTSQDRFSIAGRWSVRGFDGELSLSADNGWTLRNDLGWATPITGHELYLAADYGQVGGRNSEYLIGKRLAGGVIGLQGQVKLLGISLNYDTFIGTPFYKPKQFQTSKITSGFNVNWQF